MHPTVPPPPPPMNRRFKVLAVSILQLCAADWPSSRSQSVAPALNHRQEPLTSVVCLWLVDGLIQAFCAGSRVRPPSVRTYVPARKGSHEAPARECTAHLHRPVPAVRVEAL